MQCNQFPDKPRMLLLGRALGLERAKYGPRPPPTPAPCNECFLSRKDIFINRVHVPGLNPLSVLVQLRPRCQAQKPKALNKRFVCRGNSNCFGEPPQSNCSCGQGLFGPGFVRKRFWLSRDGYGFGKRNMFIGCRFGQ